MVSTKSYPKEIWIHHCASILLQKLWHTNIFNISQNKISIKNKQHMELSLSSFHYVHNPHISVSHSYITNVALYMVHILHIIIRFFKYKNFNDHTSLMNHGMVSFGEYLRMFSLYFPTALNYNLKKSISYVNMNFGVMSILKLGQYFENGWYIIIYSFYMHYDRPIITDHRPYCLNSAV